MRPIQLILFETVISIYCANNMTKIKMVICGQNAVILNVVAAGICSYHLCPRVEDHYSVVHM
jgi:hypothetical protein